MMAARRKPTEVTPVSGTGNGHKVRPDMQTKLAGAVVLLLVVGPLAWIGNKVTDLSDRMVRIETMSDLRFAELSHGMDAIRARLEKIENTLTQKGNR